MAALGKNIRMTAKFLVAMATVSMMSGLLSALPSSAGGTNAPASLPTITIGSVTAVRGATVTVPVSLGNPPAAGILGYQFQIDYDSNQLTYLSATDAQSAMFGVNGTQAGRIILGATKLSELTFTAGTLLNITFRVADNASNGSVPISNSILKPPLLFDKSGNSLNVTPVDGSITIAPFLPGDVSGGEVVNVFDALLALQYAVGLIVHTPENNAKYQATADVAPLDANGKPKGDSQVNVFDALAILRHAVGLDVW